MKLPPVCLNACAYFRRSAGLIVLAIGILGVTVSCTFIGVAYQSATSLIMLEVDSYLDLNEAQTEAGKLRTDELMAWHRREVLPLYVKQLRQVAGQVEQGLDAAQVSTTFDWGIGEMRRVAKFANPQQVELLSSLSAKQIAYLEKKFAKNDTKYRKEWLDAPRADMLELRFEKFLGNVERLYGSFTNEQKNQLRPLSNARLLNAKIAYEERLARQAGFVAMVKSLAKNDPKTASMQISTFIENLEKPSDYAATNRKELFELIASVSQIATAEQRSKAKATLLDYANTFEGLSRGR